MHQRTATRATALACLLTIPLSVARAATTAAEVDEDNALASTLVTPHKDWGAGHVDGPVRALFFVWAGPYDGTWADHGTRVREIVELGQRFDLQADAALFAGPSNGRWTFHGGGLGEQRAERLLQQSYQLYVIAGFPMGKLPARLQYLILKEVAAGAGLLCCGPGATEYLTARRRITPTPPELVEGLPTIAGRKPGDLASAWRLAKGRGVWLNYQTGSLTPSGEFSRTGLVDYDYWQLLVGRAALWAAGREGDLRVAGVGSPEGTTVAREAAERRVAVTLASRAAQARRVTVQADLRRASDGWRVTLPEATAQVPAGQSATVDLAVPPLRAGAWYVEVVVTSGRGTEAAGAGNLQVDSASGVAGVELAKTFVERGETITGQATLRGTPPAGAVLRLRLRDSYDRVLQQQDLPVKPGQTSYPVRYRADASATIELRVEAGLLIDGAEVDQASATFTVPKRRQGQHNFVMWDAAMDTLGFYAWRQLQQVGMTTSLISSMGANPRQQPAVLRACDATLALYSTRILDGYTDQGHMKPVCWNDEPAVTQYVQKIVDNQRLCREQGVFVYSLGDEGVTLGCCVHPACLAAYRKYLAAQYETIDRLNASWGSTYASFDEVNLLDPKDNLEAQAQKTAPARWYDRQAFARYNLMQFSGRFVQAYRGIDPQAITGFEGTGGFGDDYDAILGINPFYGPYPSLGDDLVRSAAPRETIRSNWMGYSKTGDALADAGWRMVMKGMDSIWYWMWSGIGNWRGYLRPTLDFWPATADLAEEMRPVRQGLGDLILKAQPTHSGIGVFYNVPSALAGPLDGGAKYVKPQATHEVLAQLTYDLGLDFRYLTSAMLRRGVLNLAEFRVLFLPFSQAIGPAEAGAIKRFVEQGGTVVADVRPGVFDDHCKPATPGTLDDLFGIQRTGRGDPADGPVRLDATVAGERLQVELAKARVDPGVQAAGAEALGKAGDSPVLLVNQVGRGRAILLNFQIPIGKSQSPEGDAARALLQALYRGAGARSAVQVASPAGQPLPQTETRQWQTGQGLVWGVWRQMENAWFSPKSGTVAGEPVPARITLPGPRHVYDLRAGKYLGRLTEFDTRLRWGRASFFLALPYPVGGVKVTAPAAPPTPGQAVTATIALDVPANAQETFAAWAEVIDPQGDRPLWGRQVVLLPGGRGRVSVPVAFNDRPGRWRVRVTELFSGQAAEAAWTVR